MARPGVVVNLKNGALGSTQGSVDGVAGLIMTGVALTAVVGGITGVALNTPYQIFSLSEAEAMGINEAYDSSNSVKAYARLKDFFTYAPAGSELWFMVVANTVTLTQMVDKTSTVYATALLNAAQGRIRLLGICRSPASNYVATITNGMDADCITAAANMQDLGDMYANLTKPFRGLVEVRSASTIAALRDWSTSNNNRVGMVIGATESGNRAQVAMVLGLLASQPVQRGIDRVLNGNLGILKAYLANIGDVDLQPDAALNTLHDKRYIFFASYPGLTGYYVASDVAATAVTDDYQFLSRGRTIDKAQVLAYGAVVTQLNNEFKVTTAGKLPIDVVKNLQNIISRAIEQQMVIPGEISSVDVFVDADQNVLATNQINVVMQIIPLGLGKKYVVNLGFSNPSI